ncbi:hypothetical protein Pmani_038228, partial [Petrolisthes manimaculis]
EGRRESQQGSRVTRQGAGRRHGREKQSSTAGEGGGKQQNSTTEGLEGMVGQCLPQRDRSREETALREPSRLMTVLTFLTELEGMYLAQGNALHATPGGSAHTSI